MKHATLMLILAALLSSCAVHRPCVDVPEQPAPDLVKMGFVLTPEQDRKLCEVGQTPEQKAKGECGNSYDVLADREAALKADSNRLRKTIKSINCSN